MRRVFQSALLIALCLSCLVWLGAIYAVLAVIAAGAALASGVLITYAIALGFVWPVLAVAYVAYTLSAARPKTTHLGSTLSRETSDAVLPGVEDA
jgi:hypothetical protein